MRTPSIGIDRRRFLLGGSALALGAALPKVLFAHTGGSARLVVVILRGALDGLAAVPPLGRSSLCRLAPRARHWRTRR